MGLGVMLVVEPEFRIGNTVRCRADVGADASRVGLERQHVEVAHHLHVLAAFVALGNLDLDGRRIRSVAFARSRRPAFSKAASFWRNSMAAMRRSTERTLSRYSSSLCWSSRGKRPPQISGAADDQIQHLSIQRIQPRRCRAAPPCSCLLNRRLSTLRGLISAGTACVGERKLQCE